MPVATGSRFTVASLLATLEGDHRSGALPTVEGAALDELLGWFRAECAAIVASCPAEAIPLRLPKARISDLLACERGTLARLGRTELAEPIVRGRLIDLVVAQHVTVGLGPMSELRGDLREGLEVAGDHEMLAWLDDASAEVLDPLWRQVEAATAHLQASWGTIPRAWWPRSQERVSIEVADGVLVLGAQFDLALGGPPTGLPAVIIEVKAGAAADRHRRDLLWYGLLSALRHGHAPAVVATFTAADGGLVPIPVALGSLEAAARRGLAALERLVALASGAPPAVRPNAGCPWCPELDRCEPGLSYVASPRPLVDAGGRDVLDVLAEDDVAWDPADEDEAEWG